MLKIDLQFVCFSQFCQFARELVSRQNLSIRLLIVSLLLAISYLPVSASEENTKTTVSSSQLDIFMKKWVEYKSFQAPMDPKDKPLLQAALKKDSKGPWVTCICR